MVYGPMLEIFIPKIFLFHSVAYSFRSKRKIVILAISLALSIFVTVIVVVGGDGGGPPHLFTLNLVCSFASCSLWLYGKCQDIHGENG